MGNKKNGSRSKKRKFHGNKFTLSRKIKIDLPEATSVRSSLQPLHCLQAQPQDASKKIIFEAQIGLPYLETKVLLPLESEPKIVNVPLEQNLTVLDVKSLIEGVTQKDLTEYQHMLAVNIMGVTCLQKEQKIATYFAKLEDGYITFLKQTIEIPVRPQMEVGT
nr:hypothetical protein BgiMline_019961 [Biomphalaria glabrata]